MDNSPAGIRTFVVDTLRKNKSLTEREVKRAIGKAFKVNPGTISAGVIREARKRLGIDRPGAIAFAQAMLKKDPILEAKKVIEAVGSKFGVRLGPPDVSRLRPAGSRRKRTSRMNVASASAARDTTGTVKRGRPGRPPRAGVAGGAISVTYQGNGRPEDLAAFFRGLASS